MKIVTWNINGVKARIGNLTHWLLRKRARHRLPAGDQVGRRAVPPRRGRGARLSCRDARPEGLQRRRHPVEAALRRSQPRPARRRRRRAGALHRGGVLDALRRRCGSPRSICPTAIRSAPRKFPTSSPGWSGWSAGRPTAWRWRSRWCSPATTTSSPSRSTPRTPKPGSTTRCSSPRRGRRSAAWQISASPTPSAPSPTPRHLHVLGLPGRRLAEEQRHPHRPPAAVAGSRRPAASPAIEKHVRAWEKPSDHVPTADRC